MSSQPSKEKVATSTVKSSWNSMWNEERNELCERLKLVRSSAFGHHRSFPWWDNLPKNMRDALAPYVREGENHDGK